jgi:Terpene synthase family 2, C-terminal metal binding
MRNLDEINAFKVFNQAFRVPRINTPAYDLDINTIADYWRIRELDVLSAAASPTNAEHTMPAKLYSRFSSLIHALGCFCLDLHLDLANYPEFKEMQEIFGKHLAMINDVHGWQNERDPPAHIFRPKGPPIRSAVWVFAKEMGITGESAMELLVKMCRGWEEKFLHCKKELMSGFKFVAKEESDTAAYLTMLQQAMAGCEKWSRGARRYVYPATTIGKLPYGRFGRIPEFSPPNALPLINLSSHTPPGFDYDTKLREAGTPAFGRILRDHASSNAFESGSMSLSTPRVRSHISDSTGREIKSEAQEDGIAQSEFSIHTRSSGTLPTNSQYRHSTTTGLDRTSPLEQEVVAESNADNGKLTAEVEEIEIQAKPKAVRDIGRKSEQDYIQTPTNPRFTFSNILPDDYMDDDEIVWYAERSAATVGEKAYDFEEPTADEGAAAGNSGLEDSSLHLEKGKEMSPVYEVAEFEHESFDDPELAWIHQEDYVSPWNGKSPKSEEPKFARWIKFQSPPVPTGSTLQPPIQGTVKKIRDTQKAAEKQYESLADAEKHSWSGEKAKKHSRESKASHDSTYEGAESGSQHRVSDVHTQEPTAHENASSIKSAPKTEKQNYMDSLSGRAEDVPDRYWHDRLVGSVWATIREVNNSGPDKDVYPLLPVPKEDFLQVIFLGSKGMQIPPQSFALTVII